MKGLNKIWLMTFIILFFFCSEKVNEQASTVDNADFIFGGDLSYVNQILDHGGIYKDGGAIKSPYAIFKDHSTNLVRLRLWNNPQWTKKIYGTDGKQLYNDVFDVAKAIKLSREQGMQVLLDFHFSDTWADPGKQEVPVAWSQINSIQTLKDSVYKFTFKTLSYLNDQGLMPEFVQLGNEINCGMLHDKAAPDFPACDACKGQWKNLGEVINSGIEAVKKVSTASSVKTKIILHVADPKNVEWWFDNIQQSGGVKDFDIIGFSFYPIWHTTVKVDSLSDVVSRFKSKYKKEIMILETAYPWTAEANDEYKNLWGAEQPIAGYPYTVEGQKSMMEKITQEMIDGGGSGLVYWEPAWITSETKDLWAKGSCWENNTFFDFQGNVLPSIDFTKSNYKK
jgi:arabinogalactan endo-1,4-beta-galactosidase